MISLVLEVWHGPILRFPPRTLNNRQVGFLLLMVFIILIWGIAITIKFLTLCQRCDQLQTWPTQGHWIEVWSILFRIRPGPTVPVLQFCTPAISLTSWFFLSWTTQGNYNNTIQVRIWLYDTYSSCWFPRTLMSMAKFFLKGVDKFLVASKLRFGIEFRMWRSFCAKTFLGSGPRPSN